jgi:hypothetical protein
VDPERAVSLSFVLVRNPVETLAAAFRKPAFFRRSASRPHPALTGVKLIRQTTPGFEEWIWDDGRVTRHWRRDDARTT